MGWVYPLVETACLIENYISTFIGYFKTSFEAKREINAFFSSKGYLALHGDDWTHTFEEGWIGFGRKQVFCVKLYVTSN